MSEEEQKKNFVQDLRRVFRRKIIRDYLEGEKEISQTKSLAEQVREQEKQQKIPELFSLLTEQIILADAEKAKLLEKISQELQTAFHREDLTLILLGSAAHGGLQVKKQLHGESLTENEIDYALLSDIPLTNEEAQSVHEFVSNRVKSVASDLHLSHPDTYRTCGFHNPVLERSLNLQDPKGLAREIIDVVEENRPLIEQGLLEWKDILDELVEQLIIFFEPSFPSKTNTQNIEALLETLAIVKKYDTSVWEIMRNQIIESWKMIHKIKGKHLTNKQEWPDKRTGHIVGDIEKTSSETMSLPLEKLLSDAA